MHGPPTLDDGLLLECVVTTSNGDGTTNIAPMGPIVDQPITRALLRPFRSSTTFSNLVREKHCVLHISDDVELIARAALDLFEEAPSLQAAPHGRGEILADACRWYALEVVTLDDRQERSEVLCRVTDQGTLREFSGFNRAMHAVIEATILATRLHLLPVDEVTQQIERLLAPVEKTGGPRERRAMAIVAEYVQRRTRP